MAESWCCSERAMRIAVRCEAFIPIEADLEAFSPGRVAAHDVRGRAEIHMIVKLNVHVPMTHARLSQGHGSPVNVTSLTFTPRITYRKLFHVLNSNCFITSDLLMKHVFTPSPKFAVSCSTATFC